MPDKIEGHLEVGNDGVNVVINHGDLKPDKDGVGHIVFSPAQARNLVKLMLKHANDIERSVPNGQGLLEMRLVSVAQLGDWRELIRIDEIEQVYDELDTLMDVIELKKDEDEPDGQ